MKENYQLILFSYAYNISGSVKDAKDTVQHVLYNYPAAQTGMGNIRNCLIRKVVNQSITIKNKKKRLQYNHGWLPEPVDTGQANADVNRKEIASYSMLILLEQLNPEERAAFLLKEVFGYSDEEISAMLDATAENAQRLLNRAQTKLNPLRHTMYSATSKTMVPGTPDKLIHALCNRDRKTLEYLFCENIAFYADGGKTVDVSATICTGLRSVSDLLIFIYHKYDTGLSVKATEINHQPALLYYDGNKLAGAQIYSISPGTGKIFQICNMLDPEKLKNYETTL